jgi:peptide-methionine (S)-S-oxide reductase
LQGTQYASVIYCADDIQFEIASKVKEDLQNILDRKLIKAFEGSKITTHIRMSTIFYPAHEEHQAYLVFIFKM